MTIADMSDPKSLSSRFRGRRDIVLKDLLLSKKARRRPFRLLDLGGTTHYWRRFGLDFLNQHDIQITLLNNKPAQLGDGPFEQIVGDACAVDLPDASFDYVHSNSVIEHVGSWEQMQAFASETRRLGNGYYVQTPNWWFPIEPHFYRFPMFHWLPEEVRARLLCSFPISQGGRYRDMDDARRSIRHHQLLTFRQLGDLFPGSILLPEKLFGFTKSIIAIR
jgi:hypothetical protein